MTDARLSVAKENFSVAKPQTAPLAFAALLAGNAALALGPLFVRMADVGPVAAGFWRLALALPFLTLLALRQGRAQNGREPKGLAREALWLAAVGGLFFAADLASWHRGIMLTKMANATLFGNSASLILAATTLLVARRWPLRTEALAIALAGGGTALLMYSSSQQGEARLTGDLLCLLAGLLYAGYMLSMQRARATMGSWQVLALSTAMGVLPLLGIALALGEQIVPENWGPVLMLALSSQLIGQGLLIYALPHFSALVIGLTLLLQPAIAAAVDWAIYSERLTMMDIAGGVLLGCALLLIRLPAPQPKGAGK
jgi:drug/metabolite transporter (DMT)-like permease